jgi:hypothetical protein
MTMNASKLPIARRLTGFCRTIGIAVVLLLGVVSTGRAGDWSENLISKDLAAFQGPKANWHIRGTVRLDPQNQRKLVADDGHGILVSHGAGEDLRTLKSYRDCQVEIDFMIPKGSNSGVKLDGCYEIQIYDSWKKTKLTGSDCGGIYPRGELRPYYHTIDDGTPPTANACKEPGQWQSLKITFHSPRFNAQGKKTANARFDRVELNGVVIHENAEVKYPTGAAWHNPEHDQGPLLLQGDHGPVAFRNLRIRPL